MSFSIFIGNLNYSSTESDLLTILEEFGKILSIEIIKDNYTSKSKGFAHVQTLNQETALLIIKSLNGKLLNGRPLKIEFYKE